MDTHPPTKPSAERRSQPRAKLDLFVNRFLNGHPYMCRMTDISRNGARIIPINEPKISPAPSHMGLQFQLPGQKQVVTASGVVVVSGAAGTARAIGVKFTNIPAASASVIDAFLGPH